MIRPEEIAARIRELCDERDINNYKLSKASGISMSALSHMFNRQTIPNVTTLIRICDGLGITLNELFDYGGLDRVHLTDETVRLLGAEGGQLALAPGAAGVVEPRLADGLYVCRERAECGNVLFVCVPRVDAGGVELDAPACRAVGVYVDELGSHCDKSTNFK